MKEKDFQSTFNKWVKAKFNKTAAFELKLCRTNALAFNSVAPHQVAALLAARNGKLVYKIADCGYQNPFDSFCMNKCDAYVVIKYPDFFCLIDINDWVQEEKISARKSLISERAREIASIVI